MQRINAFQVLENLDIQKTTVQSSLDYLPISLDQHGFSFTKVQISLNFLLNFTLSIHKHAYKSQRWHMIEERLYINFTA